jgi:hypothetical protein
MSFRFCSSPRLTAPCYEMRRQGHTSPCRRMFPQPPDEPSDSSQLVARRTSRRRHDGLGEELLSCQPVSRCNRSRRVPLALDAGPTHSELEAYAPDFGFSAWLDGPGTDNFSGPWYFPSDFIRLGPAMTLRKECLSDSLLPASNGPELFLGISFSVQGALGRRSARCCHPQPLAPSLVQPLPFGIRASDTEDGRTQQLWGPEEVGGPGMLLIGPCSEPFGTRLGTLLGEGCRGFNSLRM